MFSNETLSVSPGNVQSLNTVAQVTSTDAGLTWSPATMVDQATAAFPAGWAPTSGAGIQLRYGADTGSTSGAAASFGAAEDSCAWMCC